jgi:hypothetical protein
MNQVAGAAPTPRSRNMEKLSRTDLMSLEQYAERRVEFREQVIEHKKIAA